MSSSAVMYRNLKRDYPVADHGEGIYLYDTAGRRYIDGSGGACVVTVGHGVPEIARKMAEQASAVSFAYFSHFTNAPTERLAAKLVGYAPKGFERAFFCSGGSEAVETALKMTRQYFLAKGRPEKTRFISRWQSYHGNTLGALSVTGRTLWHHDYRPYLQNFPHIAPCYCYRCPFGLEYPSCQVRCATDLERVIKQEGPESIAGFVAEPIVGTAASAVEPPEEYFRIIRQICDHYDILFIADEVITGYGRTGTVFAIEQWGVTPDLIVMGKGMSGGYAPLSSVLVTTKVLDVFRAAGKNPSLPFTFACNPLASAAGLAVLEYVEEHHLFERVRELEPFLFETFRGLLDLPIVGDVRGRGFLLGIEFVKDKATREAFPPELEVDDRICDTALAKGLILLTGWPEMIEGTSGDHLLVAPPYVITRDQITDMARILRESIVEVQRELGLA